MSSRVLVVLALAAIVSFGACAAGSPVSSDPDSAVGGDDDPIDAREGGDTTFELTLTTVGPGTASVSPAGTPCGAGCTVHDASTELTITAEPDASATVTGWTGPCEGVGTATSCTFPLEGDLAVEVTFAGTSFQPTSFAYTGTAQTYTVPAGATALHIVADGASGGDAGIYTGGRGANVDATVPATGGQVLTVIVGGQPPVVVAGLDGCGASGGGGTFVVQGTTALVVAGGGGGAAAYSPVATNGGPASLTQNGGSSSSVVGGTGGNGGAGLSFEGGGGGGMLSAGGNGEGLGGQSFAAGGAGGARATSESCGATALGGFGGGGGGGNDAGGGGGGYSGGAAQDSTAVPSGGGGSYSSVAGTITVRVTAGPGAVTITPQ